MKTKWKILISVLAAIVFVGTACLVVLLPRNNNQSPIDTNSVKKIVIEREGQSPVESNLFVPSTDTALPLVINIHGGGFVSGSANNLNTQSERLVQNWNCVIATIEYKLLSENHTKEYAIDEIVDLVKHFKQNPKGIDYNIDPNQIFVMGYSAGGYYALTSAMQLADQDIEIAGQILCYPCIDDATAKYENLKNKQVAPALFLICKDDVYSNGWLDFKALLEQNEVWVENIFYQNGEHGFLEVNNPEYDSDKEVYAKNDEQKQLMLDAEAKIGNWIKQVLQK